MISDRFPRSLLDAAAPRGDRAPLSLERLLGGAFLREVSAGADPSYEFAHPLLRQAAYDSQLREPRRSRHAAVARALREVCKGRESENAALIAHHWEQAADPLRALRWLQTAANWTTRSDVFQALRTWEQVRSIARVQPRTPETLVVSVMACTSILSMAMRVGEAEVDLDHVFEEGLSLCESLGDPAYLVGLHTTHGLARLKSGDLRPALASAEAAYALSKESDHVQVRTAALALLVEVLFHLGRLREAELRADERVAADASTERLMGGLAWSRAQRGGWIWALTGRLAEARAELDEAASQLRAEGRAEVLGWLLPMYGFLAEIYHDAGMALERGREALEIAERLTSNLTRITSRARVGLGHLLAGEFDLAIQYLEHALELMGKWRTMRELEPLYSAHLAEAYAGAGRIEHADSMASRAVAIARKRGTRVWEARAELARAQILLSTGDRSTLPTIERSLRAAEEGIRETGAAGYAPRVHELAAARALLAGDLALRRAELLESRRLNAEMGATVPAERLGRIAGAA